MSAPKNRMPWVIVGALGCLALCLCIAVAGGIFFFLPGMNSGAMLAQNPFAPSPTKFIAPTLAPLSTATRVTVPTSAPLPTAALPATPRSLPTTVSSAPSPTPACPPSPALAPGILFNDDFGSQSVSECNGWALAPGVNVDYTWAQNKYTISINQTDYLGFDWPEIEFDNYGVETEAQPTGDGVADFGIVYRIGGTKDAHSYYLFGVTSDGTFYVQKKIAGNWADVDPLQSTTSPAIKQGKTKNTVGVIVRGNSFALYINHVLVKTITDDSLTGKGKVGIFAGSGSTNTAVTFSRFTVLTPEKAQADWR